MSPLRSLVDGPLTPADACATVSSIIGPTTSSWELRNLPKPIRSSIAEKIISIPISFNLNRPDGLSWGRSVNGRFSTSSAYDLLLPSSSSRSSFCWIWSQHILPKIRFFIWLCCLDKLPTKVNLCKRRIIDDCICDSCFSEKSVCHLLWGCPRSQKLWSDLGLNLPPLSDVSHLPSWLSQNSRSKNTVINLPASLVFLFGCHCIWAWRNTRLFDPSKPFDPISSIFLRAAEYHHLGPQLRCKSDAVSRLISWTPPPIGFKLNTDGAVSSLTNCAGGEDFYETILALLLQVLLGKLGAQPPSMPKLGPLEMA